MSISLKSLVFKPFQLIDCVYNLYFLLIAFRMIQSSVGLVLCLIPFKLDCHSEKQTADEKAIYMRPISCSEAVMKA